MKIKSESSALGSHYLSSLLPFAEEQPQQITKNREFYKPQKFIWNNPHRTSGKMYPFYHQQNDQYTERVEPRIKKMEEQDRTKVKHQRILKLAELRQQTRARFHSRQKEREQLQARTYSQRKQYQTLDLLTHSKTYKGKSRNPRLLSLTSEKVQNSYKKSLQQYDVNIESIKSTIAKQMKEKHDRIRNEFLHQKKKNDLTTSRFHRKTNFVFS